MTIVPRVGISVRPEVKCCSAKSWFRSIRVSIVLMAFLVWLLFFSRGLFCDQEYRLLFDSTSKSSPQFFTHLTGGELKPPDHPLRSGSVRVLHSNFPVQAVSP